MANVVANFPKNGQTAGTLPAQIVQADNMARVNRLVVANPLAANPSIDVTIYLKPAGQTLGTQHIIVPLFALLPAQSKILDQLTNQILTSGDEILIETSVLGVNFFCSVTEFTN